MMKPEPYHLVLLRDIEANLLSRIAVLTRQLERVQSEIRTPEAWPITSLDLSVRAYNVLTREAWKPDPLTRPTPEIASVGDLVQWSARDLLKIKNCGRKTLKEIEGIVSRLGLALRCNGVILQ